MSHKSEKTNNGNPATQNTPKNTSEIKINLAGEYDGRLLHVLDYQ
ncbi:1631_t:CDS:1, partial [Racocetra fulgida]